ncbi:hypothetical protein G6736_08045 [Polynucleobacter paneuropaeus]|nr:hypothetical protein [Polynucleobacter paneuropaeus]MBT8539464.1 hypothetical protein [Polynucleobacter paneuropaeus]
MRRLFIGALLASFMIPSFARTDGGGNKSSQKYNNSSGHENCYYCWKDLSTTYTPSRHKYAKKS